LRQYLQQVLMWSDVATQLEMGDDGLDAWNERTGDLPVTDMLPDLWFQDVLRASRVRLLVSVGHHRARSFLYFLRTGRIWPDADHLAPCLADEIGVVSYLKTKPPQAASGAGQERNWTVDVPTNMSILCDADDMTFQSQADPS
jgi:hypothetical protein